MLLSFEGIDGAGKTTQAELLRVHFNKLGKHCEVLREPGGTALSESIRSILKNDSIPIEPLAELLLFESSRAQLISEKIQPLLKEKKNIVILDRFYDSTLAYQGRRFQPYSEIIDFLNDKVTQGIKPELTFYLDLKPSDVYKRIMQREKNRMEQKTVDFFENVRNKYLELAKNENNRSRIITIDPYPTKKEIHSKIVSIIKKSLPHLP